MPKVSPEPEYPRGGGAKKLNVEVTPWMPGAMPFPVNVPSPQGTKPATPLAAFVKLLAVMDGPGDCDTSVAVAVKPAAVAVITMFPAGVVALTVVDAVPLVPVVALTGFVVALPLVTVNVTSTPATGFPPES